MKKILLFILLLGILAIIAFITFNQRSSPHLNLPQNQGKINIDEVCNNALTYMTFSDGASADKFVEDCKNGKHPEVIEQYKKDNNLGDGANL